MSDLAAALRHSLRDRYTVERELGRGGAAVVFLGRDLRHAREVAIKVMRHDIGHELAAERFLREISWAATLQHPHILPLFDSGADGGLLYYVMPFVEGESLRARLEREGPLPLPEALALAAEVADALAYAHSRNVLHRDIKPENILLAAGHAVVADFGIARALEQAGGERLTRTGLSIGTPAYMSPEQAAGDEHLDGRSDIYALGCVLYEMLGGEPPVTGPSPRAILARQLAGEVRSLRPLRPGISPALEALVKRALAPDPADRFASASELAAILEQQRAAALAGGGAVPLLAPDPTPPAVPSATPQESTTPAPAADRWHLSRGRVRRALVIAAALILAISAYAAGNSIIEQRRLASLSGVAVLPFKVSNASDDWTEALADLLAAALEGTPGLRVVDPWSLWRPLRAEPSAVALSPDPEEAERLSRRLGARHYVLGALTRADALFHLTLRIYRTGDDAQPHTVSVDAPSDSIGVLVQKAAVQVIAHLAPSARRVEFYATDSAAALKAYLDARAALRRGLVERADSAITRALAIDTAFALAAVEAITIRSWLQYQRAQQYVGLHELADLALRHQDRLSERQKLRAQMSKAAVDADGALAAELAQRIILLDSADVDAWSFLAYVHLVYGWGYGADVDDALEAAERAVRLDSTHAPALRHRAELSLATGDPDDMRRQLVRLRAAATPQSVLRSTILALEVLLADDEGAQPFLDTLAAEAPEHLTDALRFLRAYRPARAEELLDRVLEQPSFGFAQRLATGSRAQLWLAEGRFTALDSAIRVGAFGPASTLPMFMRAGIVTAALTGVGESGVTARAVEALERYVPVDSAVALFPTRSVWWLGWVLGAYHAAEGDTAMARRWHAAFSRLPAGGSPDTYREAIQADIEARLAHRRGDQVTALQRAQDAFSLWRIHTSNDIESRPGPGMRFHLAQQLRIAGLADSADVIFRSLVPPVTWLGTLTARASLELGRSAEERGDREAAMRHYEQAFLLWDRGGPEVQRWRDEALAGLERSGVDRGAVPLSRRRG